MFEKEGIIQNANDKVPMNATHVAVVGTSVLGLVIWLSVLIFTGSEVISGAILFCYVIACASLAIAVYLLMRLMAIIKSR